ncbi:hypothetical protein C8J57DRAFT_1255315 [Mycena rebaudengoi]|nr:hypothetical protein C8J57DRAFT_1255315 [Mycena rebaudengoi]
MPQPALLIVCAEKRALLKTMATNNELITQVLDDAAQSAKLGPSGVPGCVSAWTETVGGAEYMPLVVGVMEKVEDAEADRPGTTVTLECPTAAGAAMGKLFNQQLAYLGAHGSLESRLGDIDLWDPVECEMYKLLWEQDSGGLAPPAGMLKALLSEYRKLMHMTQGRHLASLPANFAWTWPWTIKEVCTPFAFGVGDLVVVKCNMKMWYEKRRGAELETNQVNLIKLEAKIKQFLNNLLQHRHSATRPILGWEEPDMDFVAARDRTDDEIGEVFSYKTSEVELQIPWDGSGRYLAFTTTINSRWDVPRMQGRQCKCFTCNKQRCCNVLSNWNYPNTYKMHANNKDFVVDGPTLGARIMARVNLFRTHHEAGDCLHKALPVGNALEVGLQWLTRRRLVQLEYEHNFQEWLDKMARKDLFSFKDDGYPSMSPVAFQDTRCPCHLYEPVVVGKVREVYTRVNQLNETVSALVLQHDTGGEVI